MIRDTCLDPARTNPYGGAIALGQPVGTTGAILTLRVAWQLARNEGESSPFVLRPEALSTARRTREGTRRISVHVESQ